jgi:hypothetical protein
MSDNWYAPAGLVIQLSFLNRGCLVCSQYIENDDGVAGQLVRLKF